MPQISRWKVWVPALAVVLAILAVGGYVLTRKPTTLTDKDTIVLADFDNKTGNPVFDDTLRQGLSVELRQSPFLSLISDQRVQQQLALMAFATAYANLGLSYSAVGESVLSAESTVKAWQLRDRVSDRERFFSDFTYDRQVTGNLDKAYQTLEAWLQTYPRDDSQPSPQGLLGGLATHGTGRFARVIEVARARMAAQPGDVFGYTNLASAYR